MEKRPIIAIFGATGAQGGGLARAILNDPTSPFRVRAITRSKLGDQAQELAKLGAEVVEADLDREDTVHAALQGAYGAFCVTFYWAHFSPEKEKRHAQVMADAAFKAGLRHVVWSTLEDTRKWIPLSDNRMPTLMGEYKVPHFDAKGESDRFFVNAGVPTTFLLATYYWDNMIHFGMGPQKNQDGGYVLTLPMGQEKLAGMASEDIGRAAYAIFQNREQYLGKFVGLAGDHLTGDEMASALSQALDQSIQYRAIDPDAYRALGFPGSDDLGNMFQYYRDFAPIFLASRDVAQSRSLNPVMKNFSAWLSENKHRIPLG